MDKTVKELKQLLKDRGLSTSGNKQQLVERYESYYFRLPPDIKNIVSMYRRSNSSPDGKVLKLLIEYIFEDEIQLGDDWEEITKERIDGWLPLLKKYDPEAKIIYPREGEYILDFGYDGIVENEDWDRVLNQFAQDFENRLANLASINNQLKNLESDLRIITYQKPNTEPDLRTTEFQMVRIKPVTISKIRCINILY